MSKGSGFVLFSAVTNAFGFGGKEPAEEAPAKKEEAKPAESAEDPYVQLMEKSVEHMRTTAQWIITIFTGIAAALIAGTQLSSLGKLDGAWIFADHRLASALVAGAITLCAFGVVIKNALDVLTATPKPIDALIEEERIAAKSGKPHTRDVAFVIGTGILGPGNTIESWRQMPNQLVVERTAAKAAKNAARVDEINDELTYHNTQVRRLRATWRNETVRRELASSKTSMLAAGLIAGLAIGVFTWAANPPDPPASVGAFRTPVQATFVATDAQKKSWTTVLGEACVNAANVRVIVLTAGEETSTVVSIPTAECNVAKFEIETNQLQPEDSVTIGSSGE